MGVVPGRSTWSLDLTMKWRGIAIGATIGLLVPFAVEVFFHLTGSLAGGAVLLVWPSSIMLLATESMPVSEEWRVFVPSVLVNVVLYATIGGIVTWVRAASHREV